MLKNVLLILEEDIFKGCDYEVFIDKKRIKGSVNGEYMNFEHKVSDTSAEIIFYIRISGTTKKIK